MDQNQKLINFNVEQDIQDDMDILKSYGIDEIKFIDIKKIDDTIEDLNISTNKILYIVLKNNQHIDYIRDRCIKVMCIFSQNEYKVGRNFHLFIDKGVSIARAITCSKYMLTYDKPHVILVNRCYVSVDDED